MEMSSIIVLCLYIGSYQTKRSKAALHYIIYTSVSGVLLIAASFYIASKKYSIMFDTFCLDMPVNPGIVVWLSVFTILVALAIKIPIGPFYHWLLFAHVEASTPVSIVLAAILLKIPAVAIIRIFFNSSIILPDVFVFVIVVLCIGTIIACSSAIWLDGDVKRIVALSSVVHMAGSILILFNSGRIFAAFTVVSVVLSLVSHTFLSALMFAWSGTLSERYHTRDIFQLSGALRHDVVAMYFTFLMCFFIGAVPISFVFTAEAYTILVLGVSYQLLMLLFILVAYSMVFIRMLYISCRLAFGRSSVKFSYGLTVSELSVFILFALCLVVTLFMDGGVVSTILL
jgi:NADH:ubiquinone oxidoreductase subunit 4 (subunit M)